MSYDPMLGQPAQEDFSGIVEMQSRVSDMVLDHLFANGRTVANILDEMTSLVVGALTPFVFQNENDKESFYKLSGMLREIGLQILPERIEEGGVAVCVVSVEKLLMAIPDLVVYANDEDIHSFPIFVKA